VAAAGEPRAERGADADVKGVILLWDAASGAQTLVRTTRADVRDMRFCSDGLLHAVTGDGDVLTWNPRSGQQTVLSRCPLERLSVVALSADGRRLAGAAPQSGYSRNGAVVPPTSIYIWDATTGQQLHNLRARYSDAITLTFSPDGSRLAYSGGIRDRAVRLWDVATGHEAFTLLGSRAGLRAIAFSPDGTYIAAGGMDPMVSIWDGAELTPPLRQTLRHVLAESAVPRHFEEGQTALDGGQAFATLFHLDRVVTALPKNAVARAVRAGAHAQLGHWEEAAQDYQRALDLDAPIEYWYRGALVLLKQGDRAGYRRLCERLLEQFGETTNPRIRNTVVWTCVLGDASVPEPGRLVELQKKSGDLLRRDYQLANTLGAALFRAGDIKGALKQLESAVVLNRRGGTPGDWLFQAMAHHRAGDTAKAKELLERTVQLLDRINPEKARKNPLVRVPRWEEWLELELLRREAESVLKSSKP
jgi:tetratricopeptide (TPR) repeat protein